MIDFAQTAFESVLVGGRGLVLVRKSVVGYLGREERVFDGLFEDVVFVALDIFGAALVQDISAIHQLFLLPNIHFASGLLLVIYFAVFDFAQDSIHLRVEVHSQLVKLLVICPLFFVVLVMKRILSDFLGLDPSILLSLLKFPQVLALRVPLVGLLGKLGVLGLRKLLVPCFELVLPLVVI